MPGTTHVSSSSTDTTTARAVRDDVDLNRTVWFSGGEAYHRNSDWGPACPEQIGRSEEHTLGEAVQEGKRPCRQCNPVDYRRVATDGGRDLHAGAQPAGDLEAALDFVMEAARRAEEETVDPIAAARLALAESGARLALYATDWVERDLAIDEARSHLELAVDAIDAQVVTHPARHALQLYVEREPPTEPADTTPVTSTAPSTSTASPFAPMKRLTAGTFSVVTASFAGIGIANADFVRTVETQAGDAIVTSAPGGSFWFAVAMFFVSTMLIAYAAGGSR